MKTLTAIFLLALVLASGSRTAAADTLDWTWTAPVERTDGTAFDMDTEGQGYRVFFNGVAETTLLDPGSTVLIKVFPAGEVCAEFTTVDTEGRESIKSPPSCKTVKAPPGEPSNVTVTVTVE